MISNWISEPIPSDWTAGRFISPAAGLNRRWFTSWAIQRPVTNLVIPSGSPRNCVWFRRWKAVLIQLKRERERKQKSKGECLESFQFRNFRLSLSLSKAFENKNSKSRKIVRSLMAGWSVWMRKKRASMWFYSFSFLSTFLSRVSWWPMLGACLIRTQMCTQFRSLSGNLRESL